MEREYNEPLESPMYGNLFTIEDWKEAVKHGMITDYDGCGYWVKDGMESDDEVFNSPQLDATHIIWFNK